MGNDELLERIENEKIKFQKSILAFEEIEKVTKKVIKKHKISLYKNKSAYRNYLLLKKIEQICSMYAVAEQGMYDLSTMEPSGYEYYPFKFVDSTGYVILCDSELYPKKREHRYLMELHIGRTLERLELVHHKDCNKRNNSIDNLQIVSSKEHGKIHAELKRENGKTL